jgi:glycosyltransferase involved in cell wall biosynthesis
MILIDTVYVNAGGGKALLQELLGRLRGRTKCILLCDARMQGVDTSGYEVSVIPAGELARRAFYRLNRDRLTRVFCFGNVPPPVRLRAEVAVYFHNVLLCSAFKNATWREEFMGMLKMRYIRWLRSHADVFLVQTGLVRTALARDLGADVTISELPFYPATRHAAAPGEPAEGRWSRYAYVSNGYPHKNHARLIAAWERLAKQGIYPELHLTLYGEWTGLYQQIEQARTAGARITNHGFTDSQLLYQACGYQIYPSVAESFGLGLVEAAEAGCAVIAADLPHVHAAIRPFGLFDPHCVESIQQAVLATHGRPAPKSAVVAPNEVGRLVDWLGSDIAIPGTPRCAALINHTA